MSNKSKKKSKAKLLAWSLIIIAAALLLIRPLLAPQTFTGQEIKPTRGNLTTFYSFSGSVEAKNRQTLFAEKALQIKEIKLEAGQTVKKDDVIMTTTFGEKIKAKIDGEISKIYVEENAQLMPGAKLVDIVDYSDLQINVKVDEYDLAAISKDKEASITIHALAKDVKGKIAEVSKEGTYMNGVTFFTATIALEPDSDIKVGMSAEAKVLDRSVENVLMLPVSAISFDASNKPFVELKAEKGIRAAQLEIGLTDGINAEILAGISQEDTIIVNKTAQSRFTMGFGRRPQGMQNSSGGN